jgi:hypothetical protein
MKFSRLFLVSLCTLSAGTVFAPEEQTVIHNLPPNTTQVNSGPSKTLPPVRGKGEPSTGPEKNSDNKNSTTKADSNQDDTKDNDKKKDDAKTQVAAVHEAARAAFTWPLLFPTWMPFFKSVRVACLTTLNKATDEAVKANVGSGLDAKTVAQETIKSERIKKFGLTALFGLFAGSLYKFRSKISGSVARRWAK